jgi:hypothetical protein
LATARSVDGQHLRRTGCHKSGDHHHLYAVNA